MGGPTCALLELGPGRGTLMQDILRATQSVPGFHAALDIHLLEASPALVALQRKTLKDYRAHWLRNLDALPSLPLLFVANEFFDALPVRQLRKPGQESIELWLAPERRYLPVRIRFLDRNGEISGEQLAADIAFVDAR